MFHDAEEKERVKNIFIIISGLKMIKTEEIERDYQLISNLICSFVDFMKILAPNILLEPIIIKVRPNF
jgi:hypothetical protein